MKKNYFSTLFAALMLFVAMPAMAQVNSMADLFGKYQFSADMEVTAAGESLRSNFTNDCEVTISASLYPDYGYVADIWNFAGASADAFSVNKFDAETKSFEVTNPNLWPVWNDDLCMSNIEGVYPHDGQFGALTFTYDPATKNVTVPDFSLVTVDNATKSATIMAKFRNVKLSFVGGDNTAVADLSGNWHFVPEKGEYPTTKEGSTLPTEWDMTLAATDELNKNYNATFKLGEFAPLTLKAAFDGQTLTISFNEDYLDAEKKIGFVNMYGDLRPGEIIFTLEKENLLKLGGGGITIYDELKNEYLQWYLAGNATRGGAEEAFDWEGTYIVTAGEVVMANNSYTFPETFEMEIKYDSSTPEFVITKFLGNDLEIDYNQYGWGWTSYPAEDNPNQLDIILSTANVIEKSGTLGVFDEDGKKENLALKVENGVVKFDNFKVIEIASKTLVATYKNVTAVKKGSEGTTGIESAVVENNTVEGIFDLLGRKLDAITAPGLYIVNGKKVLVK